MIRSTTADKGRSNHCWSVAFPSNLLPGPSIEPPPGNGLVPQNRRSSARTPHSGGNPVSSRGGRRVAGVGKEVAAETAAVACRGTGLPANAAGESHRHWWWWWWNECQGRRRNGGIRHRQWKRHWVLLDDGFLAEANLVIVAQQFGHVDSQDGVAIHVRGSLFRVENTGGPGDPVVKLGDARVDAGKSLVGAAPSPRDDSHQRVLRVISLVGRQKKGTAGIAVAGVLAIVLGAHHVVVDLASMIAIATVVRDVVDVDPVEGIGKARDFLVGVNVPEANHRHGGSLDLDGIRIQSHKGSGGSVRVEGVLGQLKDGNVVGVREVIVQRVNGPVDDTGLVEGAARQGVDGEIQVGVLAVSGRHSKAGGDQDGSAEIVPVHQSVVGEAVYFSFLSADDAGFSLRYIAGRFEFPTTQQTRCRGGFFASLLRSCGRRHRQEQHCREKYG
mmetsp:Transcript_13414/g.31359  ORF Transcript_13414/g.31359 Transcript_13414/m.31359 type:complete len:443 (+) Transcript_13414:133-1461(+)